MSKKNKKTKKEKAFQEFNLDVGSMDTFHSRLDKQYQEIVGDIEDIQYKIYLADKKKQKKQKKKMKKGKISFYEPKSKKARIWAVEELTGEKMFNTIKTLLLDLKPIVVIIAKMIMALLVSILSLDVVKSNISSSALTKIDTIYNMCKAVA